MKDALFDRDGSLHLGRANLVSYAHGEYFPLKPRPEGFFGYSVASPDALKRRKNQKLSSKGKEKKG